MPVLRIFFVCCIILHFGPKSYSQTSTNTTVKQLFYLLKESKPDSNRIDILWRLGDHYLYLPGENKSDIGNAFNFLNQSIDLCDRLDLPDWKNRVYISLATCYFEAGNVDGGRTKFKEVITYYKKKGNKSMEARAWYVLGDQLRNKGKNDHQEERMSCYQRSYYLFKQAGDHKQAINAIKRWTQTLIDEKKTDEAEKKLLIIKTESEAYGYFNNIYGWALDNLTTIAASKGDFYKQLFYQLKNLDALKSHQEYYTADGEIMCYNRITNLYLQLDDYRKAEIYAQKELTLTLKVKGDYVYPLDNLIICLLNLGKSRNALTVLQKTVTIMPPDKRQKIDINQFYGRIYAAMHQYQLAEDYFLRAVSSYEAMDPHHENIDYMTATYETAQEFYIATRQFKKAAPFLSGLSGISKHFSNVQKTNLALVSSQVDSASGDYLSALKHFQRYSHLKDTIFNIEKISQLNQLEVSFETKQKQNKIDLLDAQNKANIARVEKANLERNITTGGILIMLVISGITYNGIRNKIKSNRLLSTQKDEINRQNSELQVLLGEKEDLLSEKESLLADKDMLLKEVHHRVKNNLQIVMSLLSTQLDYLENKEAVQAVEESQQRVQAIALIHQKIYHATGGVSIQMRSYISDLVEDLEIFCNASNRGIQFKIMVDEIDLDIDIAVPVGLILNEAITNAIKYAFEKNGGLVHIIMRKSNGLYDLIISDNGKGLPANFDFAKVNSLGMVMMKGLSGQIRASFELLNENGLTLSLKFPARENFSKSLSN